MPDKTIPFVITDRRKFTTEGEARPDADPSPAREPRAISEPAPEPLENLAHTITPNPEPISEIPPTAEPVAFTTPDSQAHTTDNTPLTTDPDLPPSPTAEQMDQSRRAFEVTAERLDIAIRSANPGADHPPAMSFEQIVQSVYMQAILQLGGGTQEGQQPQVDILGAKQSVEMLDILATKTANNLSPAEQTLISSALFELRLAFLEITQALARGAQQRATAAPSTPGTPPPIGGGPRIVR